jgi:beta-glucosidase
MATRVAQACEVIVFVVGIEEGEFQDRANLDLPGNQEQLIQKMAETGKPIIVVLVGGSAVTMTNWIDQVDAVLCSWYAGEEGGTAVADVLFGDYNPGGRLPITFPQSVAQLPLYYNHKPTGRGNDYLDMSGKPLFPFGYGLSYTTFEYSDLELRPEKINKNQNAVITLNVKNIGHVPGEEVVQLYIRDMVSSVTRPVLELKGFQRIQLNPGQTKEMVFELSAEHFSMLDQNLNRVVEPGDFKIMIGSSSRDIRLRGFVEVMH